MNTNQIKQLAAATRTGALPFPQIVENLFKEGVEYYQVDYAARSFAFYDGGSAVVVAPLGLESLPEVAGDWNVAALRAAILDSQQNGQKFPQFCVRAVQAGVQCYFVFLRGQRVIYLGRQGEQHVEWFVASKPENASLGATDSLAERRPEPKLPG